MSNQLDLNVAEALFLAVQMEQRAISMYERALLVFRTGGLPGVMEALLSDERAHRETFERMLQMEAPVSPERQQLLGAAAGDLLFEGGLVGAVREGAFDSAGSLIAYAADEEERAAERYLSFSSLAAGHAKDTFLDIAAQERMHRERLLMRLDALREREDG